MGNYDGRYGETWKSERDREEETDRERQRARERKRYREGGHRIRIITIIVTLRCNLDRDYTAHSIEMQLTWRRKKNHVDHESHLLLWNLAIWIRIRPPPPFDVHAHFFLLTFLLQVRGELKTSSIVPSYPIIRLMLFSISNLWFFFRLSKINNQHIKQKIIIFSLDVKPINIHDRTWNICCPLVAKVDQLLNYRKFIFLLMMVGITR